MEADRGWTDRDDPWVDRAQAHEEPEKLPRAGKRG